MPTHRQILTAAFAACAVAVAFLLVPSSSDAADRRPLRVGFPPWIGYDIILHARESGLFEKHGLEVELIRFDETSDVARAVASGGLDAGFTGVGTLIANHDGSPIDIILVTDRSSGADGILARPGIGSVGDLRGVRVGCKIRATNRLILAEALAHHAISTAHVDIADVSNTTAERMFRAGSVDAIVLWEPQLSRIAAETGAKVIYRTSERHSSIFDVLVARSDLVEERREEFLAFRRVWFDLQQSILDDPQAMYDTVAGATGQSPGEVAAAWAGLTPGDRALNRLILDDTIDRTLRDIATMMGLPPAVGIRSSALDPKFEVGS